MSTNPKVEEGFEAIRRMEVEAAEELFADVTNESPAHPDGWNGMGAVRFEQHRMEESLAFYEKALELAKKDFGGELPERLDWHGNGRAALRAIHGMGMNNLRLKHFNEAVEIFESELRLNPDDNLGASLVLKDAKNKKDLWKKFP